MKKATLFKFGVTRNVEHRGNIVKLSGPSFTEEKRGIYSCICEKHLKTKAGLTMHGAIKVVSAAENQNDNKITTTNFTKTKPVNELAIAKEVQIVLDEVLDKITEKHFVNVATSEKRRGAVERKSYDNSFKMRVIRTCSNRKRSTDQDIAVQFGIGRQIASLKMEKTGEKDM